MYVCMYINEYLLIYPSIYSYMCTHSCDYRTKRGQPPVAYTKNQVKEMMISLDKGRNSMGRKTFFNLRKMRHPRLCRSAMRVLVSFYAKAATKRMIPTPEIPRPPQKQHK
jgi:hypothetical protein